ncbi:unnamed protein product [Effrenium voratum]|uniref:Uncharacterized protein n=1 Tax=Effrenium voratum TaxID=2562239 RepID=A0AA36I278_9DINO|nr:unnamed protein product [Effrenium voratum]
MACHVLRDIAFGGELATDRASGRPDLAKSGKERRWAPAKSPQEVTGFWRANSAASKWAARNGTGPLEAAAVVVRSGKSQVLGQLVEKEFQCLQCSLMNPPAAQRCGHCGHSREEQRSRWAEHFNPGEQLELSQLQWQKRLRPRNAKESSDGCSPGSWSREARGCRRHLRCLLLPEEQLLQLRQLLVENRLNLRPEDRPGGAELRTALEEWGVWHRKLVSPDDFKICSEDDDLTFTNVQPTCPSKIGLLRAEWKEHQVDLRKQQLQAKVDEFLRQNHFADVNEPRITRCGFRYTYPLALAAQAQDAAMVLMLIRCGANPMQRDHRNRTLFNYLTDQDMCVKICQLHLRMEAARSHADKRIKSACRK